MGIESDDFVDSLLSAVQSQVMAQTDQDEDGGLAPKPVDAAAATPAEPASNDAVAPDVDADVADSDESALRAAPRQLEKMSDDGAAADPVDPPEPTNQAKPARAQAQADAGASEVAEEVDEALFGEALGLDNDTFGWLGGGSAAADRSAVPDRTPDAGRSQDAAATRDRLIVIGSGALIVLGLVLLLFFGS